MASRDFDYTNIEIAAKIDLTSDYIAAICYLLEHGEERLVVAVERGVMPANIAMEIARAPDGDVQQALAEAYVVALVARLAARDRGAEADAAVQPASFCSASHSMEPIAHTVLVGCGLSRCWA
jgi:RepB plasmid partitioning protein